MRKRPNCEEPDIVSREPANIALSIADLPGDWRADLRSRLVRYWTIKASLTPLGIGLFFIAYFVIMKHPLFVVTTMPLTALDRAIPFEPRSLPVYFSLWLYVSIAPALLRQKRELAGYAAACATLSGIGLAIFVFWPTAVPTADIDWTAHPAMAFLKDTDLALNACPSMHVAFAVFTAMWLGRVLREMQAWTLLHALNALWCAGIVWSTVATRQHVVLDVLAGLVLGAAVAFVHLRAIPSTLPARFSGRRAPAATRAARS